MRSSLAKLQRRISSAPGEQPGAAEREGLNPDSDSPADRDSAVKSSSHEEKQDVWLLAMSDPVAAIKTHKGMLDLGDLDNSGASKLVVATEMSRLRVFDGASLHSQHVLLGAASAVCTCRPRTDGGKGSSVSCVAVASGPNIFFYRRLRPYFKLVVPELGPSTQEQQAWAQLWAGQPPEEATKQLMALREQGVQLGNLSKELLGLGSSEEIASFLRTTRRRKLGRQPIVTCMAEIHVSGQDTTYVSSVMAGTEDGRLVVATPKANAFESILSLESTPTMLTVLGDRSAECRIFVACRNGAVLLVKNDKLMGSRLELEGHPLALVAHAPSQSVLVSTTASKVYRFSAKGTRLFAATTLAPLQHLCPVAREGDRDKVYFLAAAGDGAVALYRDTKEVHRIETGEPLRAMLCGAYGREPCALVTVGMSGGLAVRIMRRQAQLDKLGTETRAPAEQEVPLPVPKKTKAYIEQTQREREQAAEMHRAFQRDLCKLRLDTARAYVKEIESGRSLGTSRGGVRADARILGMGPAFRLVVEAEAGGQVLRHLVVTVGHDPNLYRLDPACFTLPCLVPGTRRTWSVSVKALHPEGGAEPLRVAIAEQGSAVPLLSMTITMPLSERTTGDEG